MRNIYIYKFTGLMIQKKKWGIVNEQQKKEKNLQKMRKTSQERKIF